MKKSRVDRIAIDAWAEDMNRLCADRSPEDEEIKRHAIDE